MELTMPDRTPVRPDARFAHEGNLLNAAIRRDITDLNHLFLARALDPTLGQDEWFQLPAGALSSLVAGPTAAVERVARSPIALFEFCLPATEVAPTVEAVADNRPAFESEGPWTAARRSFGLLALGVARRLAEATPMVPRLAFGLLPTVEARLSSLSPSESFRLASWPALIRPRWSAHAHYWNLLARAAAAPGEDTLRWAYATGVCLLGQCERAPPTACYGVKRPARGGHRRAPAGGDDVPC
jgi:hypothetical protein